MLIMTAKEARQKTRSYSTLQNLLNSMWKEIYSRSINGFDYLDFEINHSWEIPATKDDIKKAMKDLKKYGYKTVYDNNNNIAIRW